jgi:hypothetical protein
MGSPAKIVLLFFSDPCKVSKKGDFFRLWRVADIWVKRKSISGNFWRANRRVSSFALGYLQRPSRPRQFAGSSDDGDDAGAVEWK